MVEQIHTKDWTGNSNSIYKTLGASNHTDKERETNDYYATEPKAMELLLEKEKFSPIVWENAVGEGHLADVLKQHGYKVKCSDIVDRGYPNTRVLDFLKFNPTKELELDIITNPPYKKAKNFVEKSLQCISKGHKVAMFLKLQFLEGKEKRKLFEISPPKIIYVASGRLLCAKNAEFEAMRKGGGSAVAYAWFVWEKGYKGKPTIDWIN